MLARVNPKPPLRSGFFSLAGGVMPYMNWKPFTINELRKRLGQFDRWFLDGGLALDHYLGRSTRVHGDIDIGVLSTDTEALLATFIDGGLEVYDANCGLDRVTLARHREQSYNYWISDGDHYKVQILVYKEEGNHVVFRRSPAIKWPIESFTLTKGELRVVNPLVIYAFKITAKSVEQKDLTDITNLLNLMRPNNA